MVHMQQELPLVAVDRRSPARPVSVLRQVGCYFRRAQRTAAGAHSSGFSNRLIEADVACSLSAQSSMTSFTPTEWQKVRILATRCTTSELLRRPLASTPHWSAFVTRRNIVKYPAGAFAHNHNLRWPRFREKRCLLYHTVIFYPDAINVVAFAFAVQDWLAL